MTSKADFEQFVRARTASLSRTAYLLTQDAHAAEDLVQHAVLQAARAWHRIEGDPEPYVRRIMYTTNISWWRRRKGVVEHGLDAAGDRPARPEADPEVRLTLAEALGRLTSRQRTVLVLRFYEDLTEVETARVLGIRPGTAKSLTRQALTRIRVVAPELADLVGSTPSPGGAQ
ncbi:SigE family RNA polymerase sigma factor [Nocardioides bruguierae]|uniref:SigE family RNA polymerase sigma factor n=1 Tax=Nocardioides bruguierae TaxID=2945102 RepID=UPI0020201110|nr:SigE family RNA polymerase sigma factor [Nocardioides bruguierae]MCL8027433.1 SigE family RNA polymerase sigma factor [Nocardioides bruguierae]